VFAILNHKLLDLIQFLPAESPTPLKHHRVQPKLGSAIIPLNVNMWWFIPITRVEEKPIRTDA